MNEEIQLFYELLNTCLPPHEAQRIIKAFEHFRGEQIPGIKFNIRGEVSNEGKINLNIQIQL